MRRRHNGFILIMGIDGNRCRPGQIGSNVMSEPNDKNNNQGGWKWLPSSLKAASPANPSREDWQGLMTGKRLSLDFVSRRAESCFHLYCTLGQHDFTLISEMPDAEAASMLALVAAGGGGIENTVTMQAFTTAEAKTLFVRAGKLAGSFKPMGAS